MLPGELKCVWIKEADTHGENYFNTEWDIYVQKDYNLYKTHKKVIQSIQFSIIKLAPVALIWLLSF